MSSNLPYADEHHDLNAFSDWLKSHSETREKLTFDEAAMQVAWLAALNYERNRAAEPKHLPPSFTPWRPIEIALAALKAGAKWNGNAWTWPFNFELPEKREEKRAASTEQRPNDLASEIWQHVKFGQWGPDDVRRAIATPIDIEAEAERIEQEVRAAPLSISIADVIAAELRRILGREGK